MNAAPSDAGVSPSTAIGPLNAFTVDVEDYYHVAALASAVSRDSWHSRESRVERNTERLLAVLEDKRVQGTFFVLGWVAERSPELVRRIAAAGHEIACHGFSHQLIYRQSRQEFREETAWAKGLLEDATGRAVLGYRAASFSIVRETLWALDDLIDLGFRYDSSIFAIRHDRYGIPDASPTPGKVTAPSGRSLLEFPMAPASFFGLKVPVTGGGYFRIFPYGLTRAGLRRINAAGRPFAFYLHPWEIDPDQPRVKVGAVSRFRHYTNLSRCETRLRRLLAEFAFCPMAETLRAHLSAGP
jgi:polysaccharide deacetylase family protein (PEP-CTERM system associated)